MNALLRVRRRTRCGYGVLLSALVLLAVACTNNGDRANTARSRDYSGCRTSTGVAAFAREIDSARPLVRRMKRGFGAPGLSIAVAVDGRVVWSEVCGYADLGKRTPVTATTRFRIGSVSKTLTATAAARLAHAGRFDLDAPIQRYVPSFPKKPHRVTARDLLGHNAGIRHYQGGEALSSVHYTSVTDALRVFAKDPLLFEPGTRHSYSSYGFDLVGAAIESISDEAFGDAVGRLVLAPLGMTQTAVDDGRQHQDWAAAYEVTEARQAIAAPLVDLSNRLPAGGFRSSAEDLARLGSRLGDETFLQPRTQDTFFSEQHLADGSGTGYGLGFEVGEAPFGRVVGHTGNVVGGTAFVLAHPKTGVAIAMTTNIGYVTVRTAPDLSAVPDPPVLFTPFVKRALQLPRAP